LWLTFVLHLNIWDNFLVARIQRDFQTEEKLKGQLEKTLPPERGQRRTRRGLYYNLGDLAIGPAVP
jgi:hypothetical protein